MVLSKKPPNFKLKAIRGRAWRFESNISTDDIISGIHLSRLSIEELVPFAFEHLRPEFIQNVKQGDIIVADKNFGIGSSREEAPAILRALGISAVIAISFARLFYRNAFNLGIPAIEFPALKNKPNAIRDGDSLEINIAEGTLKNQSTKQSYSLAPIHPLLLDFIAAGGAIPLLKRKLQSKK